VSVEEALVAELEGYDRRGLKARADQVRAELDRLAGPVVPPAPVSVTDDPETAANGSGSAAPAKAKRARKR
jgi:hypothetical protein